MSNDWFIVKGEAVDANEKQHINIITAANASNTLSKLSQKSEFALFVINKFEYAYMKKQIQSMYIAMFRHRKVKHAFDISVSLTNGP